MGNKSFTANARRLAIGFLGGLIVVKVMTGDPADREQADNGQGAPSPITSAVAEAEPEKGESLSGPPGVDVTKDELEVLTELRDRRENLDADKKQLAKTEDRVDLLKEKLGKDLDRLKRYRDQIQSSLEQEEELKDDKVEHLVSVYSAMNPEKAGARVNRMDERMAVKLLSRMDGEVAGRVLSFVEAEKAKEISESMTKLMDEIR